jgi:hypothetical protein
LEHACENWGELGPLVWEEIVNKQTVHKGLAKLFYRFKKKNRKISVNFFGYLGSTSNLGPLVWEEIENEQTVHKGLAKLFYRLNAEQQHPP